MLFKRIVKPRSPKSTAADVFSLVEQSNRERNPKVASFDESLTECTVSTSTKRPLSRRSVFAEIPLVAFWIWMIWYKGTLKFVRGGNQNVRFGYENSNLSLAISWTLSLFWRRAHYCASQRVATLAHIRLFSGSDEREYGVPTCFKKGVPGVAVSRSRSRLQSHLPYQRLCAKTPLQFDQESHQSHQGENKTWRRRHYGRPKCSNPFLWNYTREDEIFAQG